MKKFFIGLLGLALLFIAVAAFAYSSGTPADTTGQVSDQQQKFFQETKGLRKERHDLRCELMEASQSANPDAQKIAGLKKEIAALREEIQAKAKELGVTPGLGKCANPGMSGNCDHNRQLNCSGAKQGRTTR